MDSVRQRLDLLRQPHQQLEMCISNAALMHYVLGLGRWGRIAPSVRRRQLDHMAALTDELYPALRVHGFEPSLGYSAAYTVFGAQRVAVFLGSSWLLLNSAAHIQMFAQRFAELVRQSVVQPHEFAGHVLALRDRVV